MRSRVLTIIRTHEYFRIEKVFTYVRLTTNINIIPSETEVTIRKGWMLLAGFAKFEFTPAGGDIRWMFDKVDGSNDVKLSPMFDE